ncbi:MAG: Beta-lactamase [Bacteroidota bacterium]
MMRFICLFVLFFGFSRAMVAQDSAQLRNVLEIMLANELRLDSTKLTGFVVGVVDRDSTFCFGFGRISKLTNRPPDGNTIFEIGGLTHVFVAAALEIFESEGKIDLDLPIAGYLPSDFQFARAAKITTRQLLSHTSGLPKLPNNIGDEERDIAQPFADYSFENLLEFLQTLPESVDAKPKYLFSHINFAILERIIAHISQQPYKDFFEKKLQPQILPPPSIEGVATFFGAPKADFTVAQGYSLSASPVPMRRYLSFEGALGLRSNVNDLLFFMRKQLTNPILQKSHRIESPTFFDRKTSIAHAWHVVRQRRGIEVVGQSGSTSGMSAAMFFIPRSRKGVVVLSNSKASVNRIAFLILQILTENWKS